MVLLLDEYLQVSVYAVAFAGVTLAAHSKLHTLGNTCRNLYLNNLFAHYNTVTVTVRAFVLDDFSLALATWTWYLGTHHAEETLLGAYNASAAAAIGTGLCCVALGTAAMAVWASNVFLELELLCNSVGDVLKAHLYLYTQVGSSVLRRACTSAATATESTESAESSATAEDVTEH